MYDEQVIKDVLNNLELDQLNLLDKSIEQLLVGKPTLKQNLLRTSPHMYLWRKQWNWMSSIILFKLKNNVLHI
ncbi:hypothetical protein [Spiroplasma ixodetis]|uniref:hypothetical protein n=1 Tax=Spiroplasma ixodetis TaxID=2141 RepID=UPI00249112F0|nr:hypothetical protein [Spiroplasma ixodetis]